MVEIKEDLTAEDEDGGGKRKKKGTNFWQHII